MNVKNVEKKENSTAEITIEITGVEFENAVNKVYSKVRRQISIPGFRKGKAPRKLVEKMYGENVFHEDALEELSPAIMEQVDALEGIEIVGYPKSNVTKLDKDGVELVMTVGLMPEVTLGQYKGVEAPKAAVDVTEEEVDIALKPYINRATNQVSVDRPVQSGDTAVIDFDGSVDGEPFTGGKAENYELKIGSGSFIPGFEDQLIGVSAGEEKDVVVTFPEDYQADELSGKEAVFKCKVHEVREEQAPELDDEFAKDVSEFETLAELRADLKAKALERKEREAKNEFEQAVMTKVIENATMEIPETMVEYETDRMMEQYESRMQGSGISFDQYLNMMGTNRAEFRVNTRTSALRQIQNELVLKAVMEAEGVEATEDEVNEHVKELAEQYSMTEEKVREALSAETLERDVKLDKASKLIYDSAVATAIEAE